MKTTFTLILVVLLAGCSGGVGAAGGSGTPGPQGPAGRMGPAAPLPTVYGGSINATVGCGSSIAPGKTTLPTPWKNSGIINSGNVPFRGLVRAEAHLKVVAYPGVTITAEWGLTNGQSTDVVTPIGFTPAPLFCTTLECGDLHPIHSSGDIDPMHSNLSNAGGSGTLGLQVVASYANAFGGCANITGYWSVSVVSGVGNTTPEVALSAPSFGIGGGASGGGAGGGS